MDNWVQTIIISLISGGFVGFITYLMKLREQDRLKNKLRIYLYIEVFHLYNHMTEVMNEQLGSKDVWFREQAGLSIDLIFFNNEKVKEMLIDLQEKETLAFLSFYRMYTSIDSKLIMYSQHLQEKMRLQKQNEPIEEIEAFEHLLIKSTEVLESDYQKLKNIFGEIKKSDEFRLVQKKYKLKEK